MINKRRWVLYLVGVILFGLLIAILGLVYINFVAKQAVPSRPLVRITSVLPDGIAVAGQTVVVFGEAMNQDGIENVELWINGQMVASQVNPDQNPLAFSTSQSWIPSDAGNYLVSLRGLNRKGIAGQSEPVVIQVVMRSDQPDPSIQAQYIIQEGDTLEGIAGSLGITPEEIIGSNPGLGDLSSGTTLDVPEPPLTGSGTEGPLPAGGVDISPPAIEEPPHVSLPPPAPAGAGIPPIIATPPVGSRLPIPDSWACLIYPERCGRPIGGDAPPLPATDISASLTPDGCGATVSWADNTGNEVGFRIYRITNWPRFRMDLLALLSPSPGVGERLMYSDTLPEPSTLTAYPYYYMVETFNSIGQVWSALSGPVTPMCTGPSGLRLEDQPLAVEALDMTVRDSI